MHKLCSSQCPIIRYHTTWNLEIWGQLKAAHSDQAMTQWTLQLGISLYVKQNLVVCVLNNVAYYIHNVNLLTTVHSMWDHNSAPIMILLEKRRVPQHPDVARNVDFMSCSCCCCLQDFQFCMCLFTLRTWNVVSCEDLKCFDMYVRVRSTFTCIDSVFFVCILEFQTFMWHGHIARSL
jgi:hypothetical protein